MRLIIPILAIALLPEFLLAQDELRIQLQPGHNLISCNLRMPGEFFREGEDRGPDVRRMMEPLGGEQDVNNPLLLLEDSWGHFYSPRLRFNNIAYWDVTKGMMLVMGNEAELVWEGERLPADTEIELPVRGSILAYMPNYSLDASAPGFEVLAPIIEHVQYAVDGDGFFMAPEYNFSNMPPWRSGQGYLVSVDQALTFRYPEEGDGEFWRPLVGEHFLKPPGAKHKMPLLVDHIEGITPADGDQIGAFALDQDSTYGGCGTVEGGRCGMALWESHGDFEGIGEWGGYFLKYWSAAEDREYPAFIIHSENEEARYDSYGFDVIEIAVYLENRVSEHSIQLVQGWNLISLNFVPTPEYFHNRGFGPDLPLMFAQLARQGGDHRVVRVVNERGRFYSPAQNYNQIVEWPLTGGLRVLMDEAAELTLTGVEIDPERAIPLNRGWNMVAYLPGEEIDATAPDFAVVEPILDHLKIAKGNGGKFLAPPLRFLNMATWRPGQGYQIWVDEAVDFRYPRGE